jgi:hypothetical protein
MNCCEGFNSYQQDCLGKRLRLTFLHYFFREFRSLLANKFLSDLQQQRNGDSDRQKSPQKVNSR